VLMDSRLDPSEAPPEPGLYVIGFVPSISISNQSIAPLDVPPALNMGFSKPALLMGTETGTAETVACHWFANNTKSSKSTSQS